MRFASKLPLQVKCWNCSEMVKLGSAATAQDSRADTETDSAVAAGRGSQSSSRNDSHTTAGSDSHPISKADTHSAKQLPETPDDEMGPRTIAVKTAKPHQRSKDARMAGARDSRTTSLTLPQDKTIKISVMSGPSQGKEYDLLRPLVTLGRLGGGADIEIDDAEVSRVHCAVEVRGDAILLHDMRSTNGTFLGETRVFSARLEEMSTFRIGSTLLQMSFLTSAVGRRSP